MKAAIYARVSTEDQDARNQTEALAALCRARGWEVVGVFMDEESGAEPGRQALHDLNDTLRTGRAKVAVFWAWDRVTRGGIRATFDIMERWRSWGVRWESLQEPFLSTMDPHTGELILALVAWAASYERRRLSERIRAGNARRRALGLPVGRLKGARDRRPRRRRKVGSP